MLNIEPGKLYTPVSEVNLAVFNEDSQVEEWVNVLNGQPLLSLAKPHVRKYKHYVSGTIGMAVNIPPTWKGHQIWSCKFLLENLVVELFDAAAASVTLKDRRPRYAQFMNLLQECISLMENPNSV